MSNEWNDFKVTARMPILGSLKKFEFIEKFTHQIAGFTMRFSFHGIEWFPSQQRTWNTIIMLYIITYTQYYAKYYYLYPCIITL